MKISIVITVLNEEKTIAGLLDSLLAQSRKPGEIIIIDGGSKDKTTIIIRHYQKKDRRIKLLIEKSNLARARNIGIEIAQNLIIAHTDAGCLPREDWLARLCEPFKFEKVGLAAGFYQMPASTPMNQAINVFLGVPPQRFDPTTFLPSARSVAFRKSLWEEVGGYNEKLEKAAEDSEFFYKCVKTETRIARVEKAVVVWKEINNLTLFEAVQKFYFYAKGDGQAGIWWHPSKKLSSHNIKISAVFIRYFVGLLLLIFSFKTTPLFYLLKLLIFAYFLWSIVKWRDVIKYWRARLWLPVVQISSDLAVMAGFIIGLIKK